MAINLSLAPFQGITTRIYRNAYAKHFPGLDRVFAPFISGIHPEKVNPSKFADVLPASGNTIETIPQFVSIDSQEVLAIADFLADHGYGHVNWNMGCPFSRLANKMRGCGILPFPEKVRELLDEIMPKITIGLSIKTRLGYHHPDELFPILEILNDYPLKELIIHPRIGKQRYLGNVDVDTFRKYLAMSNIPVTYNGDIFHTTRYRELSNSNPGVSSWMAGRGALINPFLAAQIKGINLGDQEKRDRIGAFCNDLAEGKGSRINNEKKILGQLKAVWYYMSGVFSGGKQYFDAMKVCENSQSYLNFVHEMMQLPFASDHEIEHHWKNELKHI